MNDRIPVPFGALVLWFPRAVFEAALAEAVGSAQIAAPAQPGMGVEQPERWLTSQELAALTGVGDTTLEGWAKRGVVPCIRAGRALRFKLTEVETALRHADRRTATHAEVPESPGGRLGRNRRTTAGANRL